LENTRHMIICSHRLWNLVYYSWPPSNWVIESKTHFSKLSVHNIQDKIKGKYVYVLHLLESMPRWGV